MIALHLHLSFSVPSVGFLLDTMIHRSFLLVDRISALMHIALDVRSAYVHAPDLSMIGSRSDPFEETNIFSVLSPTQGKRSIKSRMLLFHAEDTLLTKATFGFTISLRSHNALPCLDK